MSDHVTGYVRIYSEFLLHWWGGRKKGNVAT